MSLELPPGLGSVYDMVRDVAPLPTGEDRDLESARAWVDVASHLQTVSGEAGSAAGHTRAAGNSGDSVDAFERGWHAQGGLAQHLGDGPVASALVGGGSAFVVVLRLMWKIYVNYALLSLLISLVQAMRLGPAVGTMLSVRRISDIRAALRAAARGVELDIKQIGVGALRGAKTKLSPLHHWDIPVVGGGVLLGMELYQGDYKTDLALQRDVEKLMNKTPSGRAALAWAREHNVTILFHSIKDDGVEGLTRDFSNTIVVDTDQHVSTAKAAETLMHEIYHTQHRFTPNPMLMGRGEYVDALIREEAVATVRAGRMMAEMSDLDSLGVGLDYQWAYEDAVSAEEDRRSQIGAPELTAEDKRRIGEQAALKEQIKAYSSSSYGYREQAENEWDKRWFRGPSMLIFGIMR